MSQLDILGQILDERDRQEAKFGERSMAGRYLSTGHKALIIGEEFGEAMKAALDFENEPVGVNAQHLREELIQTAAGAVAWVEWLDEWMLERGMSFLQPQRFTRLAPAPDGDAS